MNKDELLKLLDGNEQAVGFVNTTFTSIDDLTSKVNSNESKASEAILGRDKAKTSLRMVKELLGVEELNEDSIKTALGGKHDEKSLNEINNLKSKLEEIGTLSDTKIATLTKQLEDVSFSKALGDGSNVLPEYRSFYEAEIRKFARVEDGKITVKNADGTTMYNGAKEMTLEDLNAKFATDYPHITIAGNQSGSGTPPNNKGGDFSIKKSEMSHQEKGEFIQKNGNEAYLKLK